MYRKKEELPLKNDIFIWLYHCASLNVCLEVHLNQVMQIMHGYFSENNTDLAFAV